MFFHSEIRDVSTINAPSPPEPSVCSMQRRLQAFRNECDAVGLKVARGRRDISQVANMLVDDKHGVMYRMIWKAGSTTWLAALTKAMGGDPINKALVHSDRNLKSLGIKRLNAHNYKWEQVRYRLEHYFKFIVVRHPYDRIHSAWRDRWFKGDATYRRLSAYIASKSPHPPFSDHREGKPWTNETMFRVFVQYLVQSRTVDTHWAPYRAFHPCAVQWDAIIKLETMSIDAPLVLKMLNLSNYTLPWMHAHGSQNKPVHFRKSLPDFKLLTPEASKYLREQYSEDMRMFGYSWNDEIQEAICLHDSQSQNALSCCWLVLCTVILIMKLFWGRFLRMLFGKLLQRRAGVVGHWIAVHVCSYPQVPLSSPQLHVRHRRWPGLSGLVPEYLSFRSHWR